MVFYDMLALPFTTILAGYYSIHGMMFCSDPTTTYLSGIVLLCKFAFKDHFKLPMLSAVVWLQPDINIAGV